MTKRNKGPQINEFVDQMKNRMSVEDADESFKIILTSTFQKRSSVWKFADNFGKGIKIPLPPFSNDAFVRMTRGTQIPIIIYEKH